MHFEVRRSSLTQIDMASDQKGHSRSELKPESVKNIKILLIWLLNWEVIRGRNWGHDYEDNKTMVSFMTSVFKGHGRSKLRTAAISWLCLKILYLWSSGLLQSLLTRKDKRVGQSFAHVMTERERERENWTQMLATKRKKSIKHEIL